MDACGNEGTALTELAKLIRRYPVLEECRAAVYRAYCILKESFNGGGKVLICGNGGSASVSAWDRPASSGFFDNWGWRN